MTFALNETTVEQSYRKTYDDWFKGSTAADETPQHFSKHSSKNNRKKLQAGDFFAMSHAYSAPGGARDSGEKPSLRCGDPAGTSLNKKQRTE